MAGLMDALRITAEGAVTSFRYPYFAQGVQPTYLAPPPATLFGHVCSALGEVVPPDEFQIAVQFSHGGRFMDFEHIHLFGREAKLSPFNRELLFQPRLTLYINRPDWLDVFRHPRYAVTLGRSQDVMSYTDVRVVSLRQDSGGYVENALLPLEGIRTSSFYAMTMPRYISPRRYVTWGKYALAGRRQKLELLAGETVWVDEQSESWDGLQRTVIWMGFTDAD